MTSPNDALHEALRYLEGAKGYAAIHHPNLLGDLSAIKMCIDRALVSTTQASASSERAVALLREAQGVMDAMQSRYVSGWEANDIRARIDGFLATLPAAPSPDVGLQPLVDGDLATQRAIHDGCTEKQELPPLTQEETAAAFEWLRHKALVAGENNGAHHAYVALRAWAELKAAQSATAPSAEYRVLFMDYENLRGLLTRIRDDLKIRATLKAEEGEEVVVDLSSGIWRDLNAAISSGSEREGKDGEPEH